MLSGSWIGAAVERARAGDDRGARDALKICVRWWRRDREVAREAMGGAR